MDFFEKEYVEGLERRIQYLENTLDRLIDVIDDSLHAETEDEIDGISVRLLKIQTEGRLA